MYLKTEFIKIHLGAKDGQDTWRGQRRADYQRQAGHLAWTEEGRLPKTGRTLGVDGGGPTSKESRGDETARLQEYGKTAAEVGGLCKGRCKQPEEDDNSWGGAAVHGLTSPLYKWSNEEHNTI